MNGGILPGLKYAKKVNGGVLPGLKYAYKLNGGVHSGLKYAKKVVVSDLPVRQDKGFTDLMLQHKRMLLHDLLQVLRWQHLLLK